MHSYPYIWGCVPTPDCPSRGTGCHEPPYSDSARAVGLCCLGSSFRPRPYRRTTHPKATRTANPRRQMLARTPVDRSVTPDAALPVSP